MSPALRARLLLLALAAALAAPVLLLSSRVADGMGVDQPYEVRYLPSGRTLAFLPPAVKLSIANAYWLATVQYIGDQHSRKIGSYEQVYPLVDLVTDLDPAHGYAYQTAGITLSAAGRLDQSDWILKKGIEKGPNWWTYPFYIAFNEFFYRGDYAAAAEWARRAARLPGASPNISHLALALEVKSGDPESGLALVRELLATAGDEPVRERLEEQVRLARLQVDFRRLDGAVAEYVRRHGRPPARLEVLVQEGVIEALPAEPFGGRYELHPDGTVHSTARDFRFRPPERARPPPSVKPDPPPRESRNPTP